jgi:hypothetical protein
MLGPLITAQHCAGRKDPFSGLLDWLYAMPSFILMALYLMNHYVASTWLVLFNQ